MYQFQYGLRLAKLACIWSSEEFSSWRLMTLLVPVINNPVYPSLSSLSIPRKPWSNHTSLNPSLMGNPYRDSNSFALQTRVHVSSGYKGNLVILCYQNHYSCISNDGIHLNKIRIMHTLHQPLKSRLDFITPPRPESQFRWWDTSIQTRKKL